MPATGSCSTRIAHSRETFVNAEDHPCSGPYPARLQGLPYLGNLNSLRDWGHQGLPRDAVADDATGPPEDFSSPAASQHSVRSLSRLPRPNSGSHLPEGSGVRRSEWIRPGAGIVAVDPRYFRPPRWRACLGMRARHGSSSDGRRRSLPSTGGWKWCA